MNQHPRLQIIASCLRSTLKITGLFALAGIAAFQPQFTRAADHFDAPALTQDQAADINDVFFFLDPNDNRRVIVAMTVHGFIAAGENVNASAFDPGLIYQFRIENTGDAEADASIEVRFSKQTSRSSPQTATVRLPNGTSFNAPTTVASLNPKAPKQVVTRDTASNVDFFAGLVDDPFFFDIPAFSRFVASVGAGNPDPTTFQRGRDSFAGYNTLAIALSIPVGQISRGFNTPGIFGATMRKPQVIDKEGNAVYSGQAYRVDRMGTPAVNVALVPFAEKDAYNAAGPQADAKGKFAPSIVATLQALGTNPEFISILAGVAVVNGDYVRLDTRVENKGEMGGTNPKAAFPNGRRLADDTIDIILTLIANGSSLGDNVNANDVELRNKFPFFATAQQPRDPGVIDDNTRN